MEITSITIENFKSIDKLEFDIKKFGDSHTAIFVGINESGKSNILKAFSYFSPPAEFFDFESLSNQKNEESECVSLKYYLKFEKTETYLDVIKKNIKFDGEFIFEIEYICKRVYAKTDGISFDRPYELENNVKFFTHYLFSVKLPKEQLFVNEQQQQQEELHLFKENDESDSLKELTKEYFENFFMYKIVEIIETHEPKVSYWTPSDEYLLSDVDLNSYAADVNSNKPLKNIFILAGFDDEHKIKKQINKISSSPQRSKLISKLNDKLNEYLNRIWKHNIEAIIEITEIGRFSLLFRDEGKENKHDRFLINDRSDGVKHFLSLILSLSLESKNNTRKNELILIDEPEIHLHPSGIRDLLVELLNIGKKNYVFVATHSPFLIDKKNKERHYIIKKNNKAITEKKAISGSENIIDDEVLREAFGLEVFKDLLNPHSLIVEGCSDKIILQKAFNALGKKDIGVTNGHGSNIDTLASKLNHNDLSILVVVDDDKEGRKYKENILNIGGVYDKNNVFTIRDLAADSINNGTIEDLLDKGFLKSQFIEFYKTTFDNEIEIDIVKDETPFIEQISIYLKKHGKYNKLSLDAFKKQLSDNFQPSKTSLKDKNPLLHSLAEKIVERLNA